MLAESIPYAVYALQQLPIDLFGELIPGHSVADGGSHLEGDTLGRIVDEGANCLDFVLHEGCLLGAMCVGICFATLEVHGKCTPKSPVFATQRGNDVTFGLMLRCRADALCGQQRTAIMGVFGVEFVDL